jgi:hypothetical protein
MAVQFLTLAGNERINVVIGHEGFFGNLKNLFMNKVIELLKNELTRSNENMSYHKKFTHMSYNRDTRETAHDRIKNDKMYSDQLERAINVLSGEKSENEQ